MVDLIVVLVFVAALVVLPAVALVRRCVTGQGHRISERRSDSDRELYRAMSYTDVCGTGGVEAGYGSGDYGGGDFGGGDFSGGGGDGGGGGE